MPKNFMTSSGQFRPGLRRWCCLAAVMALAGCAAPAPSGKPGAGQSQCSAPASPLQATLLDTIDGGPVRIDPLIGSESRVRGTRITLVRPTQVAAAGNDLFVTDTTRRTVFRIDRGSHAVSTFGPAGRDEGGGLHVDRGLNVYVGDPANRRVVQYTRTGSVVKIFRDEIRLKRPVDITMPDDETELFVADGLQGEIAVFGRLGGVSRVLGERGDRPAAFRAITALTSGPDGLYLVDTLARKVQVIDPRDGSLHYSLGGAGLRLPVALAVDRFNRVFVADGFNNSIQVFQRDLPAAAQGQALATAAGFLRITDLWLDDEGRLHVADADAGRIQVLHIPRPCP